jgi:HAE1 family hydrophobic/amphiphilic exporter-1
MSISEISIRRPVFAWMLMLGLILFGALSLQRMGMSEMPNIDFPVVNINLTLDNAAPEVMEHQVVDIIENAVMGIEGLQQVTSQVSQGVANVTCQFEMSHNVNVAVQEVEDRIQRYSHVLPTLLYPPVITKTNPEDRPILWILFTKEDEGSLHDQMIYAKNNLKNQFSMLEGVGTILFAGYVEPNLRVWLDRKKLYRYSLTSADVLSAIQAEHSENPAGRIESSLSEANIRVLGEAQSVQDFGKIRIQNRAGAPNFKPVVLNEVARIEAGVADIRQISRLNGKRAVGLGIVKQHGANAVELAKRVREKVDQMQDHLLPGYHLAVKLDRTRFVKDSIDELMMSLVFAALLTSLVCYLFLGSWSSTLNVFFAIPTSIVGALSVLHFFGFTLNTFTLLGLSLAIGIVVDDAIMMLENIVRHYDLGKTRKQAALEGSNEITFAAIATTVAIGAIFIPVIFLKGVIGRFFYQYGITVTAAVFLSLLEALTLTPMRCSRYLHSGKEDTGWVFRIMNQGMHRLALIYKNTLASCLNHRFLVVFVSMILFLGSMGFLSVLKKELIPSQDQSLFLLSLRTPVGTSLEVTDALYQKAEAYLSKQPEIDDVYTTLGNYQNNNVVNMGEIYVLLKDSKKRNRSQNQLMRQMKLDLKRILDSEEVYVQDLSLTGLSPSRGYPVEFTLEGPDWKKLVSYAEQMKADLQERHVLEDVNSDFQPGMPEIQVIPDRAQASRYGVSLAGLSQEVQAFIGGQVFPASTQYAEDAHRYYIRMRSELQQVASLRDMKSLQLPNNRGISGDLVPLEKVVSFRLHHTPQLISRINRFRAISMYANVGEKFSQKDALGEVLKASRKRSDPEVRVKLAGTAQAFEDAFDGLIFALILGVVVAYMVLASQFNSFVHPVTVLMALPFSLSGAFFALYITGQSLSLFSMIGLILLMGIVKKNAILLVDFTNQKRAEGLSCIPALLEACPIRLRPILMTSFATIAGAIPAAWSLGPGAESRIPMAIALMGGVAFSTFLTLFVIPCVYSLLSRWERPDFQ